MNIYVNVYGNVKEQHIFSHFYSFVPGLIFLYWQPVLQLLKSKF